MGVPASSSTATSLLSWCCIGAQKAGTSTLFDLLKQHPGLFIPPGKEEPLFHQAYTDSDLAGYLATHLPLEAVGPRLAGTVTPQYMSSPDTAARLHAAFPRTRIIAILRDPVPRAFSQHRMNIRRGLEQRSFADAVDEEVAVLAASEPSDPDDELTTYVRRGLYHHILQPWFDLFGNDRVHVVFTDDLEANPLETMHGIHRFLGVDEHTTGDEGVRRHADPPRHRFPQLRRRVTGPLRRAGLLDRVPGRAREQFGYRIESALARFAPATDAAPKLDETTVKRLRKFYAADGIKLEERLGRPTPWR